VQHKESRPTIPPPSLVASVGFDSLTRSDGTTKRPGLVPNWVLKSFHFQRMGLFWVSRLSQISIAISVRGTSILHINSSFLDKSISIIHCLGSYEVQFTIKRWPQKSSRLRCLFRTETVSLSGLDSEEPSARWKQSWQRLVDAEVGSIPVNYIVINWSFYIFF
jgi:hypothetical protein